MKRGLFAVPLMRMISAHSSIPRTSIPLKLEVLPLIVSPLERVCACVRSCARTCMLEFVCVRVDVSACVQVRVCVGVCV